MTTTALFVELLITGLQASLWLLLVTFCFLGHEWINPERLKGFEAIIAIIALPIVYPLGVFVDYLSDQLFRPWELKIRKTYDLDNNQTALGLLVKTKDVSLASHFAYLRSRIRISRSSALNFTLITLTSVVFTAIRCRGIPKFPYWRVILLELFVGTSLALLAALSWRHINRSFFKWIVRSYNPEGKVTEHDILEEPFFDTIPPSSETGTS